MTSKWIEDANLMGFKVEFDEIPRLPYEPHATGGYVRKLISKNSSSIGVWRIWYWCLDNMAYTIARNSHDENFGCH